MRPNSIDDPEARTLEKSFGEALRKLRLSCGLSQEALGFMSGYHRTYISLLERGRKSPSLQTIFRLSNALGTEPSEIVRHVQNLMSRQNSSPIDD